MNRRTAALSPPCHPCGLDPRPQRADLVVFDGSAKQALETGRTRLLVAGLVFALAFLVVCARLVDVSLLNGAAAGRLAQESQRDTPVTGRADIVDRNGIVLATSLPTASLYANPRQLRRPAEVAERLSRALPDLPRAELVERLSSDRAFVWIKRNLTPRQEYDVNRLGIPGLYFRREEARVYPHGEVAAHVVGFTDVDGNGLAGLERAFDASLRDSATPLQLSLDLRVQYILTDELYAAISEFQAIGGAGVMLDADSGEVIALASLPSFDPNQPGDPASEARFNRASLGVYEMGSVFKIFTTAMALDAGVVGLRDDFDVTDPIRVARFTIRDFKPKLGRLSVPEIFMYSSNIGTVQMAMRAGTTRQRQFLERVGLTEPAQGELPEVGEPMLPSPWREINTMTISYGHGLAVSPLQLSAAVAAVVNGGVLKPTTFLKRRQGAAVAGRRVISTGSSESMRWLLRLVVQHGTGSKSDANGYLVGGKTGTADKLAGRRYARNARIASFVAAFPITRPRYVIFLMVDEPKGNKSTLGYATGGWVAAPAVRRVIERVGPLLGLPPAAAEAVAVIDDLLIPASAKGFAIATR